MNLHKFYPQQEPQPEELDEAFLDTALNLLRRFDVIIQPGIVPAARLYAATGDARFNALGEFAMTWDQGATAGSDAACTLNIGSGLAFGRNPISDVSGSPVELSNSFDIKLERIFISPAEIVQYDASAPTDTDVLGNALPASTGSAGILLNPIDPDTGLRAPLITWNFYISYLSVVDTATNDPSNPGNKYSIDPNTGQVSYTHWVDGYKVKGLTGTSSDVNDVYLGTVSCTDQGIQTPDISARSYVYIPAAVIQSGLTGSLQPASYNYGDQINLVDHINAVGDINMVSPTNPHGVAVGGLPTLTTKGDIYVRGPSAIVRLPAGTAKQALVVNPLAANGVEWADNCNAGVAVSAGNAHTVDGFHASQTPGPNSIVVLHNGKLPAVDGSLLTGISGGGNMAKQFYEFTESGTFFKPEGVGLVDVILCGAGGGGASGGRGGRVSSYAGGRGGGGGGGATTTRVTSYLIKGDIDITIAPPTAPGATGGVSMWDSSILAPGGLPGIGGNGGGAGGYIGLTGSSGTVGHTGQDSTTAFESLGFGSGGGGGGPAGGSVFPAVNGASGSAGGAIYLYMPGGHGGTGGIKSSICGGGAGGGGGGSSCVARGGAGGGGGWGQLVDYGPVGPGLQGDAGIYGSGGGGGGGGGAYYNGGNSQPGNGGTGGSGYCRVEWFGAVYQRYLDEYEIFTADGVWTAPDEAYSVTVTVIGGGGGGGGGLWAGVGAGGGGGGTAIRTFIPTTGATMDVFVGVGGTPGYLAELGDGVTGITGGTTSFGLYGSDEYCSAAGGAPGGNANYGVDGTPGVGGVGATGTTLLSGDAGSGVTGGMAYLTAGVTAGVTGRGGDGGIGRGAGYTGATGSTGIVIIRCSVPVYE